MGLTPQEYSGRTDLLLILARIDGVIQPGLMSIHELEVKYGSYADDLIRAIRRA